MALELSSRSLTSVITCWNMYTKSPVTLYGFSLQLVILFVVTIWYLWSLSLPSVASFVLVFQFI